MPQIRRWWCLHLLEEAERHPYLIIVINFKLNHICLSKAYGLFLVFSLERCSQSLTRQAVAETPPHLWRVEPLSLQRDGLWTHDGIDISSIETDCLSQYQVRQVRTCVLGSSGVQTPEDGRTQSGHSAVGTAAVGTAADLMTSPSQLISCLLWLASL